MPHVVTDNCALCRFTECIALCPVECFHADAERVYIDPDVCIDCGACVPACPVRAIADSVDLAPGQKGLIALNRTRSAALPLITAKQAPLPTAEQRRAQLGY
jgi:ferredoxin